MTTVPVFYAPAYTEGTHDFDTTRKAAWIADSLARWPMAGVALQAPSPASAAQLMTVHDPGYVEALRTGEPPHLADSGGFPWREGTWASVTASTGGVIDAALAALGEGPRVAGSLSSGLHHARRGGGAGFCTINGLAVAAHHVLTAGLVPGVLVLDLDAHCGGGTAELLGDDPRVRTVDVATSSYDRYRAPEGWRLDVIHGPEAYLPTVRERLDGVDLSGIGLVLYNAGMDPFERCVIGGLRGIDEEVIAEREHLVFSWARAHGLPIAFVLAGGYTGPDLGRDELVDLHRLTLDAAARVPAPASAGAR